MPPYGITLESVTMDVGQIDKGGMRKVDARHYNGYLVIPGLVYHMSSKIKNIPINDYMAMRSKWEYSTTLPDMDLIRDSNHLWSSMEHFLITLRWRKWRTSMNALETFRWFLLQYSWSRYTMHVGCSNVIGRLICSYLLWIHSIWEMLSSMRNLWRH